MQTILTVALTAALIVPALARDVVPFVALAHDFVPFVALARDSDRFASSPLKPWFDQLKSGKGLCCSFADGVTIKDVDWDVLGGHYRVRLDGKWLVVPDAAVVTEPNRYGRAVVWPYQDASGATQIRCFMPGSGA